MRGEGGLGGKGGEGKGLYLINSQLEKVLLKSMGGLAFSIQFFLFYNDGQNIAIRLRGYSYNT